MEHGFFRVAACVPPVKVADVEANTSAIIEMLNELDSKGVQLAVFPELCVTGYTCGDLFHSDLLLQKAMEGVHRLAEATKELSLQAVIGAPLVFEDRLYNSAVVIGQGSVKLTIPKTYIPTYNEFYERRLWTPAPLPRQTGDESRMPLSPNKVIQIGNEKVGIEICEDLWVPIPPSTNAALSGAKIIVNLSASPDIVGKYAYLRSLIENQSARCICAYIYAGAGFGESSTDLVFDGKAFIAENGRMLAANERWQNGPQYVVADVDVDMLSHERLHHGTFGDCADRELAAPYPSVQQINLNLSELLDPERTESLREELDRLMGNSQNSDDDEQNSRPTLLRYVNPHPFVPADDSDIDRNCEEIVNIQAAGLAQRLKATGCKNLVVGISGGLDSTLALLVATRAFDRLGYDRKGILGVTMPGFGTTGRTHSNALTLMNALGVSSREIPIGDAVNLHFADIGHDPSVHDITYENSQARERTQILMDLANQTGGMVLGTGDLSELALGWATYNGDQMSMYGVNASVPKTLVKFLVRWFAFRAENPEMAEALVDIIDTPVSPELLPPDANGEIAQKTEDTVGPYELHDFFLHNMLRYGFPPDKIYFLACQAFIVQHRTKAYQGRGGLEVGRYTPAEILRWLRVFYRRFFSQQFKRSCMPDGPKVGSICLSPRGDWRMPSDASAAEWLHAVDRLQPGL